MHTGFAIINVHPINLFLECLYSLSLKNYDFDKENDDNVHILTCTQVVALWGITQENIYKAWHEMERWTVLNSEEMMGRHRDFLHSSEIELAKDNFYTHRKGGRIV